MLITCCLFVCLFVHTWSVFCPPPSLWSRWNRGTPWTASRWSSTPPPTSWFSSTSCSPEPSSPDRCVPTLKHSVFLSVHLHVYTYPTFLRSTEPLFLTEISDKPQPVSRQLHSPHLSTFRHVSFCSSALARIHQVQTVRLCRNASRNDINSILLFKVLPLYLGELRIFISLWKLSWTTLVSQ